MDPSLRLSCEELLELPYFGEEVASWGRESERPGRRHDKGSRRRQAGVSVKHPIAMDNKSHVCSVLRLHIYFKLLGLLYYLVSVFKHSVSVFRFSTCLSYQTATSPLRQM